MLSVVNKNSLLFIITRYYLIIENYKFKLLIDENEELCRF